MAPDGERPGAAGEDGGATETARSLAMLAAAADLPGPGWEVAEDRTWSTGGLDPTSEKSRRARRAGTVTAWRTFRQRGSVRSAWVEVVPYATGEDAAVSLRQSPRYFTGAGGPDEEVVAEHLVEDLGLPGVPDVWMYEKTVRGPDGTRHVRYVAGTVAQVLFIASCSGEPGQWTWQDVVTLAATQADLVRRSPGTGGWGRPVA